MGSGWKRKGHSLRRCIFWRRRPKSLSGRHESNHKSLGLPSAYGEKASLFRQIDPDTVSVLRQLRNRGLKLAVARRHEGHAPKGLEGSNDSSPAPRGRQLPQLLGHPLEPPLGLVDRVAIFLQREVLGRVSEVESGS